MTNYKAAKSKIKQRVTIALDAMGGDYAPLSVIEGASRALFKNSQLYFKIFGDKDKVMPILLKYKNLANNYEFFHTSECIKANDQAFFVLRNGAKTSMGLCLQCVKNGDADAVISSGNTGALMALSKMILGTLEGIDRPAIVTLFPTRKLPCTFLDLGANSVCSKENLLQFAVMGSAFSSVISAIEHPKVGLLNIGSEAIKGNDLVKAASDLISQHQFINYCGFAEGNDILKGDFDVIVADGFTGNIALKAMEGTISFIKFKGIKFFKSAPLAILGGAILYLLTFIRIEKTFQQLDPKNYNGAMLIGLNGISVKSHGNAGKKAFASAINVTYKLVIGRVNEKIKDKIELLNNPHP
ncbi:Phosphate acyltransferase [Candidatus Hepatincolaceae symbiont of Richtersius coronifer]